MSRKNDDNKLIDRLIDKNVDIEFDYADGSFDW